MEKIRKEDLYLPKTPEWKAVTHREDVYYKHNQNKISTSHYSDYTKD